MLKIAHISDIHYRGSERHEEYKQVFNEMFSLWRNNPLKHKPDLIICTGDIFHTKTQGITPEVINEITWMFKTLLSFAPVISILGNHDANLKNLNRISIIEAIHSSIDNPQFYLFRNSCNFPIEIVDTEKSPLTHKLMFSVFSPFDTDNWKNLSVNKEHHYNIALYHGPLQGCLYDNEEPAREHSDLNVKDFKQYDLTLLGDIHKHQFLNSIETNEGDPLPNLGYPGSLIQQNFGESLNKGFLQWDLFHPSEIEQGNMPYAVTKNQDDFSLPELSASNEFQTNHFAAKPENKNQDPFSIEEERFKTLSETHRETPEALANLFMTPKDKEFYNKRNSIGELSKEEILPVNRKLISGHAQKATENFSDSSSGSGSGRAIAATNTQRATPIFRKFWNVNFLPLRNLNKFITVEYPGVPEKLFNLLKELCPEGIAGYRIRVVLNERNITPTERAELFNFFKTNKVLLWKTDPKYKNKLNSIEVGQDKELERIAFKRDVGALCDLIRNYNNSLKKSSVTEDDILSMRVYLQDYLDKINNELKGDDCASSGREIIWNIERMEFDNLYGYGEDNEFNIKSHNGFVGVFGPNRSGKSSLIGSLCFGLFNTTDRGPVKSSFIVNRNKTEAACRVWFKANGEDYFIDRKINKAVKRNGDVDEYKASTSVDFYKIETDGTLTSMVKKNDDSRVDTDKVIRGIIGNPQDFFMTTLCSSRGMDNFISEKDTQRKVILNKFFDTNIFEQIYKLAYEEYNEVSKRLNGLSIEGTEKELEDLTKLLQSLNFSLENNIRDINFNKQQLLELDNKLSGYDSYRRLKTSIENINNEISFYQKKLKEKQEAISCGEKMNAVNSFLSSFPTHEELNKKASLIKELAIKTKELKQKKNHFENKINETKQIISTKEKSIVKLTTVPCGDSFPDCRFIRDSHADKSSIPSDRDTLKGLLASLEEVIKLLDQSGADKDNELESVYRDMQVRKEKESVIEFYEKERMLHKSHIEESEKVLELKQNSRDKLFEELKQFEDKVGSFSFLEEEKRSTNRVLQELNNNQSLLIKRTKEIEYDIKSRRDALEAARTNIEKYKILEKIVDVFSKNAIPAMVLKSQLPVLNREINKILSGIVDFQINLETEIGSNSLEVFIIDSKSGPRVIEMASGMERVISSLAIRAALQSLTTLPKNDMLVIDEGLLELDSDAKAKCLDFIQGTLKSYYRLILIISHENQIKENVDSMIEIVFSGNETASLKA